MERPVAVHLSGSEMETTGMANTPTPRLLSAERSGPIYDMLTLDSGLPADLIRAIAQGDAAGILAWLNANRCTPAGRRWGGRGRCAATWWTLNCSRWG